MSRWTYLGERPGVNAKRVAVWRDEAGEQHAWKAMPATRGVVGYLYDVAEFNGTTWPKPQWTNEQADDIVNVRLENDHQQQEWAIESAERKAKERTELSSLYAELDKVTEGLSYEARTALLHNIQRRMWSR